jgi:hypothetical protein
LHLVPQPREHFGKCFALSALILDDENLRVHKFGGTGTATTCEIFSKGRSLKETLSVGWLRAIREGVAPLYWCAFDMTEQVTCQALTAETPRSKRNKFQIIKSRR